MTAYHGGVNPFTFGPEELDGPAALFLPSIARSKGSNPWGSARVAALARLGDSLYAMHYVCPGIGKVALMDELAAFSNQTARFRDVGRAFIFAGDIYKSVLSELDRPTERKDAKLLTYGGAGPSSSSRLIAFGGLQCGIRGRLYHLAWCNRRLAGTAAAGASAAEQG